ncbi:MAG: RNA polymerase sigma factor [Coriobacteriia bacterium]|nr:RNA polymerase sigma factor [Coriobacteriia bacterium]
MDDRRFEDAWRKHGGSILRYCRFAAGSLETGEDIAAETFARFLQSGDGVKGDKVEAWLFTVARNLVRSHQRSASRWRSLLPQLGRSAQSSIDPEYTTDLAELLEPLGPNQRLTVYLRVIEDRPFAQVARIIGRSEAATKKTVYRALAQLRDAEQFTSINPHHGGVEHE